MSKTVRLMRPSLSGNCVFAVRFHVQTAWGKPNDIKDAKDRGQNPDFPGWLFALFNPLYYRDAREDEGHTATASTFDKLAFVLRDEKEDPFACIMFDDIPRLRKCIAMLTPPIVKGEWDTLNLKIPPRSEEAYWRRYRRWDKDTGGMIGNCWHIPFSKILHLATVTMIGADPEIKPSYTNEYGQEITAEMQEKRLMTLKRLAVDPDGTERRVSIQEILKRDPKGRYMDFSALPLLDYSNPEHLKAKRIEFARQCACQARREKDPKIAEELRLASELMLQLAGIRREG